VYQHVLFALPAAEIYAGIFKAVTCASKNL